SALPPKSNIAPTNHVLLVTTDNRAYRKLRTAAVATTSAAVVGGSRCGMRSKPWQIQVIPTSDNNNYRRKESLNTKCVVLRGERTCDRRSALTAHLSVPSLPSPPKCRQRSISLCQKCASSDFVCSCGGTGTSLNPCAV